MDKRRIFVPVGLVTGLVLIGVGLEATGRMNGRSPLGRAVGMGDDPGGCNASVAVVPTDVGDVEVAEDLPLRKRSAGPTDAELEASVAGLYVMKLNESASTGATLRGGRMVTGIGGLDRSLEDVGASNVTRMFAGTPRKTGSVHLGLTRTYVFESSLGLADVEDILENNPEIDWVHRAIPMEKTSTPNDPLFALQWNMATLGIPQAHDVTQGEGVIVAVIDTGVSAGADGYLNLLPGRDIVDNDDDPADEDGHGTHVAGTIAQATNNGLGVMGVAPQARILPVRVLGPDGGIDIDVAEGIVWAVDNGAQVINLSLGGAGYSQALADAVAYAHNNDVVVVAATGNDSFTDYISYPAAFSSVIAVGATDLEGEIAPYSNQGPGIDLTAPGGDVTQDLDGDGYGDGILQETQRGDGDYRYIFFQGTSMATPHVAGTAALLIAAGLTRVDDVHDALLETADDRGPQGYDLVFGNGIVNPIEALKHSPAPVPVTLEIENARARVRTKRPRRAAVRWGTTLPGTSQVSGSDGSFYADQELVTAHRVVTRGTPGSTVTYTIRSDDTKGATRTEQVTVTFPPRD